MTPPTDPNNYDENSVFNRIFAEKKRPRKATKAERMANIFASTPAPEPDIQVSDFLPSY